MKLKILIIQESIPNYRIALFNELSRMSFIELTIVYFGENGKKELYKEVLINKKSFLSFKYIDFKLLNVDV
ncbi:MAG: hypothetical protein GY932_14365 [Arcobacter sp.]|nr:hypothetical protein [Arcobacter sp.]